MPEEGASPSGGWRAVYGAMDVATTAEDGAPPVAPDAREGHGDRPDSDEISQSEETAEREPDSEQEHERRASDRVGEAA